MSNPFVLKADFETLRRIERELQTGLVALSRRLLEGMITLEELAVIIAYTSDRKVEEIERLVVQGKLSDAYEAVAALFAGIFGENDEIIPQRAEMLSLMERFPD